MRQMTLSFILSDRLHSIVVDGTSASGRRTCNICPHQNIISITSLLSLSLSLLLQLLRLLLSSISHSQTVEFMIADRHREDVLKMFENNSSKSFACTLILLQTECSTTKTICEKMRKKPTHTNNSRMILFSAFWARTPPCTHGDANDFNAFE